MITIDELIRNIINTTTKKMEEKYNSKRISVIIDNVTSLLLYITNYNDLAKLQFNECMIITEQCEKYFSSVMTNPYIYAELEYELSVHPNKVVMKELRDSMIFNIETILDCKAKDIIVEELISVFSILKCIYKALAYADEKGELM